MIQTLVIFGASGDLTSRFLMPAIVRLHEEGKLPEGFRVLGIAQDDWNQEKFRSHLKEKLAASGTVGVSGLRETILGKIDYCRADVTNRDQLAQALSRVTGPLVAYLALPPALFAPSIESLVALKLPKGSKVVLEKPFGENLKSAQSLNRLLHESFPEQDVFRLDHFLGKQTVQNILGLRFANRIFEPVWSTHHIERVEIIWDETITAAGRASFYDATGALRDMIQNHLLQLLALVAMEPLHALDERTLRDHKVAVLRAVRRLEPDEVGRQTVRGRYTKGVIGGKEIPSYVEESGVRVERHTETFAQVTLAIDNWRWAGVPFVLRTGKALGRDRREITIHFKSVPHLAFGQDAQPVPNRLSIELSPDRIALSVNVNEPGDLCKLDCIELDKPFPSVGLPAYARLLVDILEGDPTLSIRDDEAEESWRIVEPILQVWREGGVPLIEYAAGSDGPVRL
ncbi:glucose-6-phosphate dehydrogenase [Candidatus Nitrospira inopinata]|uniref:Glucose-6-phosphate 1-dehydrogenase n=1 Tax=Candidatus Nitrospira inopinata TaxID=1715989 RepID=A0A0S4KR21_9BACT|nr:glucose-6-phosphate dehydrogenase [Candidatus Nitrospira inopinata]CUQ65640.1 Glucose-6-phosphate 1-dehydrogenase [Candidatus Nitrospira inopinata]